jgi:hypothetical protein
MPYAIARYGIMNSFSRQNWPNSKKEPATKTGSDCHHMLAAIVF